MRKKLIFCFLSICQADSTAQNAQHANSSPTVIMEFVCYYPASDRYPARLEKADTLMSLQEFVERQSEGRGVNSIGAEISRECR
jgi:hypothetical protein